MKRINVQTDIRPLSEFRKNMAEMIQELNQSRSPLVLTQHGRSVAVVMSPEEYESLVYTEEFKAAVREGIAEADAGNLIPHEEVMKEFKRRHAERKHAAKERNPGEAIK